MKCAGSRKVNVLKFVKIHLSVLHPLNFEVVIRHLFYPLFHLDKEMRKDGKKTMSRSVIKRILNLSFIM